MYIFLISFTLKRVRSLSSLKTHQPTLHTFYPLVTGPAHSCAISTPRRAYSPTALYAHWTYRIHCHLCPTRYSLTPEPSEAWEGKVPCPRTQHWSNVSSLRGEKHDISLEILHQADGVMLQKWQSTTFLTIAPGHFWDQNCVRMKISF